MVYNGTSNMLQGLEEPVEESAKYGMFVPTVVRSQRAISLLSDNVGFVSLLF